MPLSREKVLEGAFTILDRYGLGDLTMRRLATELGVQAGGLYWHFANKQSLLAAMADRIAESACLPAADRQPVGRDTDWRTQLATISSAFRRALLAHRDGAELVAAGYALHPGSGEPLESMIKILHRAGLEPEPARAAAAAMVHFVLGNAGEVQAHDQLRQADGSTVGEPVPDHQQAFTLGLQIFLDGIAARTTGPNPLR